MNILLLRLSISFFYVAQIVLANFFGPVPPLSPSVSTDSTQTPPTWIREFGWTDTYESNPDLTLVEASADGGYILAGKGTYGGSFVSPAIWIAKFGSNDQPLWSLSLTNGLSGDLRQILPLSNGDMLLLITTLGNGSTYNTGVVARLSAAGTIQWQRQFDNGFNGAGGIALGADNTIGIAAGNGTLIKLNPETGQLIWHKRVRFDASRDTLTSILPTPDGGFIVGGAFNAFFAIYLNGFVARVSATGDLVWQKIYSGSTLLVAGAMTGNDTYTFIGQRGILIKIDGLGNVVWTYKHQEKLATGTARTPYFYDIQSLPDGHVLVAGATEFSLSGSGAFSSLDAWLLNIDSAGQAIWSRRFGVEAAATDSDAQLFKNIAVLPNGIIAVGQDKLIPSPPGSIPNWIARLTLDGQIEGACSQVLPSSPETIASSLTAKALTYTIAAESSGEMAGTYLTQTSPMTTTTLCGNAPQQSPTISNAGFDFTTFYSVSTSLDGSKSTNSSGGPLLYQWTQTSGPTVTLKGSNTVAPSFVTPGTMAQLTFELTAMDLLGESRSKDTVTVLVDRAVTDRLYLPVSLR